MPWKLNEIVILKRKFDEIANIVLKTENLQGQDQFIIIATFRSYKYFLRKMRIIFKKSLANPSSSIEE